LCRHADYLIFGERSENRWVLMLDQAAPGGLIKYNLPTPTWLGFYRL